MIARNETMPHLANRDKFPTMLNNRNNRMNVLTRKI